MVQAAIQDLTMAIQRPQQGTLAQHLQPTATKKLQELTELFMNNNNTTGQDPRQVTIIPRNTHPNNLHHPKEQLTDPQASKPTQSSNQELSQKLLGTSEGGR
jgi:hypothetical protein